MKHNSPGGLFSSVFAILVIFACAVLYEHGIINDDIYLDILSSINGNSHSVSAELEVHFLDVGQAECILIKAPEKNVLIDAGDIGCEKKIENYLRTQGIFSIDLFIISHPHADHMGSSSDILRKFPVSELIIPEIPSEYLPTTSLFNDFLSAANKKNCRLSYAKQGQTYDLGGGAYLEILSPVGYSGDNLNNYSVISKLTYGENSFLFTGDLEKEAELLLVVLVHFPVIREAGILGEVLSGDEDDVVALRDPVSQRCNTSIHIRTPLTCYYTKGECFLQ